VGLYLCRAPTGTVSWSSSTSVQEGGLDNLKGKKIGYIFLDAGYGREPIPLLEQLAEKHGFELMKFPVGVKEMQNQSSQWLNVRRDRPDYMIMWGWGAMNPTAIKEAVKIRIRWTSSSVSGGLQVMMMRLRWRGGQGLQGYELLRRWYRLPGAGRHQKHVVDAGLSTDGEGHLVRPSTTAVS
jgi:branched-chain amino acid transport system substrate-binding protein